MRVKLYDLEPYFDRIDVTPTGWPAHFAFFVPGSLADQKWANYPLAARPAAGRAAGGRGISQDACLCSGLGEAVEIASCCEWGDEDPHHSSIMNAGADAVSPARLSGLSPSQVANRETWNNSFGGLDWLVRPTHDSETIAWVCARDSFSGNRRMVPADAVLIGRRSKGDPEAICIADTSGCAANSNRDMAELSALLELIERDAIGRWWYGARQRPGLSLAMLPPDLELRHFVEERERKTTIFDITTDLAIPAVAAVSWNPDGKAVSMGFSCRLSHEAAMKHALVEMLQGEIGLQQRVETKDPYLARWLESVSAETPHLNFCGLEAEPVSLPQTSPAAGRDLCLDHLRRAGCDVLTYEHTRPEFEIPVIRAIAPDLCRDKPRWGYDRLLAMDVRDLGDKPQPSEDGHPPNTIPLMI